MIAQVMTAQVWIAAAIGCAAIVDDLARRRISNWIPLSAGLSGLVMQSAEKGWPGTLSACLGVCAGGAAFLIFYLMGGLGGGDVKLMAGFGAVLGPWQVLEAALWAAGCGGMIAAAVIGIRAIRHRINHRHNFAASPAPPGRVNSIPYAPAITLGAWLTLISNGSGTHG